MVDIYIIISVYAILPTPSPSPPTLPPQWRRGTAEMLESLKKRWQQGRISDGQAPLQTSCLSSVELLTILTSSLFPITSRRRVYNSCVGSVMFYVSKTWDPTSSDLHRLQPNDRAMIRWMCGVTTIDQVSSQDLLERMQLDYPEKVIHSRRLRQHGHVEHSEVGWRKSWEHLVRSDPMDCLALHHQDPPVQ